MKCKVCGKEYIELVMGGMCTECFKDCDCTGLEKL